jgi:hypothetical protein
MQLDHNSIIAAVGEVLATERNARIVLEARVAELIDDYGNLVRTPGPVGERGAAGERGPVGDPGPRGLAGDIGPGGPQGERGEKGERGLDAYPGEARGLWDASAQYRAMDVVSHNGSEWRAICDDPGDLPGPGWMLGAKGVRGRPGEKGPAGERGAKGDRGADGIGIEEMTISDTTLLMLRSDGTVLSCDLMPVIERYYRQVEA